MSDQQSPMERARELYAAARAYYQQQGIPAQEVDEDALGRYVLEHLSDMEEAALGLPSDAEFDADVQFALFSLAVDDLTDAHGLPRLPLGIDDADKAKQISELKHEVREQIARERFWNTDTPESQGDA